MITSLNPDLLLARLLVLLFGFPWHELAHESVAYWLGDTAVKREGRLTLNPIRHLDPFGSLMLLLTGFGWSHTGELHPSAMRRVRSPRPAMAFVALAGPVANLLLGFLFVGLEFFILRIAPHPSAWALRAVQVVDMMAFIEFSLAVFNMVPIPPLDGATVLEGVAPLPIAELIAAMRPYAALIFIALFFVLPSLGFDAIFRLIVQAADGLHLWVLRLLILSGA